MADQQGDATSREDATRDAPAGGPDAAKTESGSGIAAGPRRRRKMKIQDRFDRPSRESRVGAHRYTAKPRRFWAYFLAGLVGIGILTGIGIFAVHSVGSSVTDLLDPQEPEPPVEQVQPELNPDATIAVLNGTESDGLGFAVADAITDNDWGQIAFSEVAASRDVDISAVFYTSVADEAMALGLAKELGGVSTYQNYDYTKYGVQLVVLLGADYAGPGSEAAEAAAE